MLSTYKLQKVWARTHSKVVEEGYICQGDNGPPTKPAHMGRKPLQESLPNLVLLKRALKT